jgi:hypothetical protein
MVHNLVIVSNNLVFAAMIGTVAVYLWLRSEAETIIVVKAFALNGLAAIGFYVIYPYAGPFTPFHVSPKLR